LPRKARWQFLFADAGWLHVVSAYIMGGDPTTIGTSDCRVHSGRLTDG
jgi:hypothetical protein